MFLWCANIPSDLRTCTKVGLFQVKVQIKSNCECSNGKLSQWRGFTLEVTVVEIVTVKASKNLKLQHISTSGLQQVPYQSLTNHQFPQGSIGFGIWFGIR